MRNLFLILIAIFLLSSCGKKKEPSPSPVPVPSAVVLSTPLNNEACITGIEVSASDSKVSFSWSAGANANRYVLTVTNLLNKVQQTLEVGNTTAELTLKRNTPYSWYVTSKSNNSSTTANSPTWKFYNSGPGLSSYPPYPAELVSPSLGQTVTPTGGKIALAWKGSDADNDIANYDVYLGTSSSLTLIKAQHLASPLTDVAVNANTTYYWKVITRDAKGNTSDSGVFEFKTN